MVHCCGPVGCGIAGLTGAIISVTLAVGLPFLVSFMIDQELRLTPGTTMYKFWEESPVPMYIHFYFFNVTNSADVLNFNAKPILQEIGPFTYTEVHERINITINDNNATLQFKQKRYWNFVEQMSTGSLQDNITTLNVPLLSGAYTIRFFPDWIKFRFNRFLEQTGSTVFVTHTVEELLFEGYEDPLLDFSQSIPPGWIDVPSTDKFGWFYGRNGSEDFDGVFNIYTGVDDISKLDMMDMWNYMQKTEYYKNECGYINGSFGEGWPPRRDRTSISMYSSDLCRSITLDYTEDVSKKGVTFYRFAGTKRMFGSVDEFPENWCFCEGEDCLHYSGVVNSSTCRYGSPAFVSFPHYYLADPFYLNQVEGLSPSKEKHEFHVDLEPRMSVPLEVTARFQINIQLQPIDGIGIIQNAPNIYMPVIWFGVNANLSDKLLGLVHFALLGPYIGSFFFFLSFIGCMVIVARSRMKYVKMKRELEIPQLADDEKTEDLSNLTPQN